MLGRSLGLRADLQGSDWTRSGSSTSDPPPVCPSTPAPVHMATRAAVRGRFLGAVAQDSSPVAGAARAICTLSGPWRAFAFLAVKSLKHVLAMIGPRSWLALFLRSPQVLCSVSAQSCARQPPRCAGLATMPSALQPRVRNIFVPLSAQPIPTSAFPTIQHDA